MCRCSVLIGLLAFLSERWPESLPVDIRVFPSLPLMVASLPCLKVCLPSHSNDLPVFRAIRLAMFHVKAVWFSYAKACHDVIQRRLSSVSAEHLPVCLQPCETPVFLPIGLQVFPHHPNRCA